MREPVVALVLSPEQWLESFHRHCADHGGTLVRCVIVDPQVEMDEAYDVLVVSDRWPALTASLVHAVQSTGRRVLAVSSGGARARFAAGLGVDRVVPISSPTERVAAVQSFEAPVAPSPSPTPTTGSPTTGSPSRVLAANDSGPHAAVRGVVVVSGSPGSGVTELALAAAVVLADRREPVVLADVAGSTGGIALRLGLGHEPNLADAVAAVGAGAGRLEDTLVPTGRRRLRVLVGPGGVAAPDEPDVLEVVRCLASRGARVVLDLGNGECPALLGIAAPLLAVADGSPAGIVGILDSVGRLPAPLVSRAHVVVNREIGRAHV